jgi:hypothetical protein
VADRPWPEEPRRAPLALRVLADTIRLVKSRGGPDRQISYLTSDADGGPRGTESWQACRQVVTDSRPPRVANSTLVGVNRRAGKGRHSIRHMRSLARDTVFSCRLKGRRKQSRNAIPPPRIGTVVKRVARDRYWMSRVDQLRRLDDACDVS